LEIRQGIAVFLSNFISIKVRVFLQIDAGKEVGIDER